MNKRPAYIDLPKPADRVKCRACGKPMRIARIYDTITITKEVPGGGTATYPSMVATGRWKYQGYARNRLCSTLCCERFANGVLAAYPDMRFSSK